MPRLNSTVKEAKSESFGRKATDGGCFQERNILFLSGSLFFASIEPLAAETLLSALARAYSGNPDLNQSRASVRARDEEAPKALAGARPKASIQASAGPQYGNLRIPAGRSATGQRQFTGQEFVGYPRGATLNISQNISDGGRTENSLRQAESNVFAARATMRLTEQRLGTAERRLGVDIQSVLRSATMCSARARGSQSGASSPKKRSSPFSNAASKAARNSRRNKRASAFAGRKKPGLQTIPGAALPGVHHLRGKAECEAIRREIAAGAKRAVVLGASFLGMEIAMTLLDLGLAVTIVEERDRVLTHVESGHVSDYFRRHAEERGATVLLSDTITTIHGTGRIREVETRSGMRLPCDLLMVSIGVAPVTDFLKTSGTRSNKGWSSSMTSCEPMSRTSLRPAM